VVALFTPDPLTLRRPPRKTDGHSYLAYLVTNPTWPKIRTEEHAKTFPLAVHENDTPLGPVVSMVDVTAIGNGRYAFGNDNGAAYVVFTASDNSNPNANGRTYRVEITPGQQKGLATGGHLRLRSAPLDG